MNNSQKTEASKDNYRDQKEKSSIKMSKSRHNLILMSTLRVRVEQRHVVTQLTPTTAIARGVAVPINRLGPGRKEEDARQNLSVHLRGFHQTEKTMSTYV
ncbi:hypothetical protein CBL_08170 [Carabus blaptoides fortunei]